MLLQICGWFPDGKLNNYTDKHVPSQRFFLTKLFAILFFILLILKTD